MKLTLTLRRQSGPDADVVVTADAATTVGDLGRALTLNDPLTSTGVPTDAISGTLELLSPSDPGDRGTRLGADLALSDATLGSGATVRLVSGGPAAARTNDQAVATLTVLEGPDRGREFRLPLGTGYLGRESGLLVTLTDPLVSKQHARIDVSRTGVRVVDLNSANGLEVDGALVTRIDVTGVATDTVVVGDSRLRILRLETAPQSAGADAPGPVEFTRSPRVETRYPGREFTAPAAPSEPEPQPFPWVALFAPLLLGALFAFTGRGISSLVFVASSPVLMLGTYLSTRANRRRKQRLEEARFEARATQLDETLTSEAVLERSIRLAESPSAAEVREAAMARGPLLWTRRPEHWQFLGVNLGIGRMPSRNSVTITGEDTGEERYLTRLHATRDRFATIDGVPVTENLFFAGALGIAGDRRIAAGALRSLLVQITGLHSPAEVVVAALVSPGWTAELDWLKWLPHTTSPHSPLETGHLANSQASGRALLSALEQVVEERASGSAARGAAAEEASALVSGAAVGESSAGADATATITPGILLVITDDAPVDRARLVALAEHAADAGIYPVWVSGTVEKLPAVTRTYVSVEPDGLRGRVGLVRLGREIADVAVETLSSADALVFARSLAPVVDAGALVRDQTDLPRSVPFLTLVGSELGTQPTAAVERWRQNDSILDRSGASQKEHKPGRLRALVGSSGADAMHLDLRTQGPHALVGGTTGSGKSEFLQAWVLGMATEYSPDRVTFLFVDYKGGSAFAECVRLPHSVGIVTDLSPHLVRRALTSLRAELHFRETLFARRGAKDIMDLEKKGDPETPPALVIVIDEFAALASEVPEFVDGVVDIAQRGRSFGIHLIMATQRPAGVIRDNLRANTNLRVALRMADESDSIDVVGDRVAGTFSPEIPGRAVAKTGPGRVTAFQSAYAGGWTSDVPDAPSISIAELRFGSEVQWEARAGENVTTLSDDERGPTDQARIVTTLRAAASTASVPEPRRPWLPQLASAYDLTLLGQRTDTRIAIGVRDIPETQAQEVLAFHPDTEGSLAIYGASGTGKTVTLRTLAAAAGITPRGGPVEVYGMDFGTGALRMLESLPHVGSVVAGDDPDRIVRLLGRLRDILDDRGPRYSAVDAASLTDYRRITAQPDEPRILLVLDNYPGFRSDFETGVGRAVWYGVFLRILSEGRALGVHVALTADRPGSVPTAVSSNIPKRVVLRQTEDSSYVLLGVPGDVVGPTSPPGRAVVDGLEAQIAIVGGLVGSSEQADALKVLGETIARTGRRAADPIGTLPAEIAVATLPSSVRGLPVLGVSDETLDPLPFDPIGVMLLAGPPASGRSNALAHVVRAVDRAVPGVTRYYFGHPRSRLAQEPGWEAVATTIDDAADLAREVAGAVAEAAPSREAPTPGILVVIEQIADFLNTPADGPLVQLIKAVKRSDHFLVADSETSQWSSTYPLLAEIKSARTGLLLQPDAPEGDMLLRTSLPRVFRTDFPIGRGFHVARGRATRVQIPLEDEA